MVVLVFDATLLRLFGHLFCTFVGVLCAITFGVNFSFPKIGCLFVFPRLASYALELATSVRLTLLGTVSDIASCCGHLFFLSWHSSSWYSCGRPPVMLVFTDLVVVA